MFRLPVNSGPWPWRHRLETVTGVFVVMAVATTLDLRGGMVLRPDTFESSIEPYLEYAPDEEHQAGPSADFGRSAKRDYTVGCVFSLWDPEENLWDLTWEAWLKDGSGNVVHSGTDWVNDKPAINGALYKAVQSPDSSYNCEVDWYVGSTYVGHDQTTVPVQVPTSLGVHTALSDHCSHPPTCQPQGCTGSCQAYYYKYRDYQIKDASNQPINKVMNVEESFSTPTNTCNATFIQGNGSTNSAGIFRDSFFFYGNGICNGGGSCTVVRNQTWKEQASQNNVGSFVLTYTCSSFGIQ